MNDEIFPVNNDAVFYCNVCTVPCYAFTGSLSPTRCIRSDLDVSEKANWNLTEKLMLNKLLHE